MIKIIEARALTSYRIYVRFSDGAAGEIDLSDLAGQGVFAAWSDPFVFGQVRINSTRRSLEWSGQIDLCADALYMRLTGKSVRELFPKLTHEELRA